MAMDPAHRRYTLRTAAFMSGYVVINIAAIAGAFDDLRGPGAEEDFQLFLALLDSDRFEGRFRDGVHQVDVTDLMRRMIKESLVKFDGRPLFPERVAHTVPYELTPAELQNRPASSAMAMRAWNMAVTPT